MNCDQCRRHMLLEESGELNFWHKKSYWNHLNACTDCRVYRNDLNRVQQLATQRLPDASPSPHIHEQLLEAARNTRQRKPRPQARGWKPALVLTLALLCAIFWTARPQQNQVAANNPDIQNATLAEPNPQPEHVAKNTTPPQEKTSTLLASEWFDDFEQDLLKFDQQLALLETGLEDTDTDTVATDVFNMENWEI